ncbi:MAG: hypothetical protein K6A43_10555 [Treponema sp.]|nr:hypothetical protein [Treponema sp.]
MFKKLLSALALASVFVFGAFAYDGTVFSCEILDAYTSTDFDKIIGSDAFEQALLENLEDDVDGEVDKFFSITMDNIDEEDMDVIDGVEQYIDDNYTYSNGSTLATGILRNKNRDGADGWYVVSNYTKRNGWSHYMFYFHIAY